MPKKPTTKKTATKKTKAPATPTPAPLDETAPATKPTKASICRLPSCL